MPGASKWPQLRGRNRGRSVAITVLARLDGTVVRSPSFVAADATVAAEATTRAAPTCRAAPHRMPRAGEALRPAHSQPLRPRCGVRLRRSEDDRVRRRRARVRPAGGVRARPAVPGHGVRGVLRALARERRQTPRRSLTRAPLS